MIAPKSHIANLYRTPEGLDDRNGYVCLDRNERTVPFPPEVTAEMVARITPEMLVSYPFSESLYRKLARWLGLAREMLLLTNGSDAAIKSVFEAYVAPGDEVVCLSPTYAMYSVYCEMFGASRQEVALGPDLRLEVGEVLERIGPRTRLVALANPNQPTGTVFAPQDLIRLVEHCSRLDVLALVDEAYYPFYEETMLPLVGRFSNLIVTRSFSKACGLPSVRLGYLAGHPEHVSQLFKTKTAHDLNAFALALGEYIVDHDWLLWNYVEQVRAGRDYLEGAFQRLGLEPLRSQANFMLIRLPEGCPPQGVIDALKEEGYLIRGPFAPPLERCIRVTVGPEEQMRDFMEGFERSWACVLPYTGAQDLSAAMSPTR